MEVAEGESLLEQIRQLNSTSVQAMPAGIVERRGDTKPLVVRW